MDAASSAVSKLLEKAGQKDTTVDQEVAPAVEHETVTRDHEQREQTVVEKEKHKDHYHTTVQPLKDREVEDTGHEHEQAPTQYREVEQDGANKAKTEADAQRSGFEDKTEEGATLEKTTQESTVSGEHVHHHLHETIQPVIEKETVKPSVTHKTIPVKEKHNEAAENHGTSTATQISVDDFKNKLDGESTSFKKAYDGAPEVEQST